jgi:hypothetical protein
MIDFTVFCFWIFVLSVFGIGWFSKKACDDIRADEEEKLARARAEDRQALWDANMSESERLFEGGVK